MRTRQGFVSNSSSSSFLIYGFEMKPELMADYIETLSTEEIAAQLQRVYTNRNKTLEVLCEEAAAMSTEELTDWFSDDMWDFANTLGLDYESTDYGPGLIGVSTDPTCLSLNESLNGWLTAANKQKVDDLAADFGVPTTLIGDVSYG
jgi:hypothetical protein